MGKYYAALLWGLLAQLEPSGALAGGPFGVIKVGNWSGGAYTNDANGAFSHCAAGTGYANGIQLLIGQNAQSNWLLGFGSENFRLATNETFPIDVTFDGKEQFHLFGTAVPPNLVTAILPTGAAVAAMRKAHLMVAVAKGRTFNFNLNSTGALFPVIANCVVKINTGGVSSAGDFSISVPKPVVAKPITPTPSTTAVGPSNDATKLIDTNGTGFVIGNAGQIVTNNHVINDCVGDVRANLPGEAPVTLRVVSKDETNDLALLQAPREYKETAAIKAGPVRSGDAVVAIGFPFHGLLSSDMTVTTGIVSSLSGLLNDTRFLQITAAVQPGNRVATFGHRRECCGCRCRKNKCDKICEGDRGSAGEH